MAFKVMQPDGSETETHINQSKYNWVSVASGVPQGTVLGPLYYIYLINIVSKVSKFVNTKLCHRTRNPDDIMEQQEDINKLVEWADKWQMNFNVDK